MLTINKYNKIFILVLILLAASSMLQARSSFSGERLREATINYIKESTEEDVEISISKTIEDVTFSQNGVTARFSGDKNFRGTGYAAIEFVLDDKVLKRIQIPCNVKFFENVSVATRNIQRGEIISANDVEYQRKDVTYFNNRIASKEGIVGREARVNIPSNSIFTELVLKKQEVIKRASKVEIRVISGAVQITANGTAMQDASAGEQVRVRRDGTQTILTGIAAEDGSVLINLR